MKRRLSQRLVVGAAVFFWISGFSRVAFSDFQDARVLPAGIGRTSLIYGQTSDINSQFTAGGTRESITQPYTVDLNAKTLKAVDPNGLGAVINTLNASGFKYNAKNTNNGSNGLSAGGPGTPAGDAIDLGTLTPSADGLETQYDAGFQYGLTDRLTIGFNVPIIHVSTTATATLTGPNTAQNLAASFGQPGIGGAQASSIGTGLHTLGAVNVPYIRSLVEQQAGYNLPTNSTQQGVGDVMFGGRFNYYKSDDQNTISSLQAGITAPTGKLHDPSNPTQVDLGNGAWGIGFGQIFNYSPVHFLTFSNGFSYTHFLPASRSEIVQNYGEQSILPPVSDEQDVSMQLGDRYDIALGASLHLTQALSLSGGYDWWWKKQDDYSGNNPSADYSNLSFETNEYVETLQAGASVNTIEAFKRKDFPIPCGLAFNLYVPQAGRNATITPYGTLELDIYI